MKIHLAISDTKQFFKLFKECNVENILISYAYFKDKEDYIKCSNNWFPKRIILDSGAFSVWNKDDTIDIDKYIKFCKEMREFFPKEIEVYNVNLDVLPGRFGIIPTAKEREQSAIEGWKNMEYMNQNGLEVIHVFHQHEDFKWLSRLMKEKNYIGLSPANDVSTKMKLLWLDKCFAFQDNYLIKNKIKCHGFAVTGKAQMMRYPFYSVDSSSWTAGGKYAQLKAFTQGKMKGANFKKKEQFLDIWDKLQNKTTGLLDNYLLRNVENIKFYQDLEKYTTEVWQRNGIKWG